MMHGQDPKEFIPLYQAIAAVKKELKPLVKDNKVSYNNTSYCYVEINQILEVLDPILEKNGLLLLQPIMSDGNYDIVRTTIFHIETGTQIASSKRLEQVGDAQKQGSLITYYRRYTLQSLLGMRTEDDDGLTASGKSKKGIKPKTVEKKNISNDDF